MPGVGISAKDCIRFFRSYIKTIDEILVFFDEHGWVLPENKEKAQELLKRLKEMLREDYELRDTRRGHEGMTEVENAFFLPAIHKALTRINVKTNSNPSGKWVMELLHAQSEIRYYLNELQDVIEKFA